MTAEEQALTTQLDQLRQELDARQSVDQGSLEESVTFIQSVSYPVTPLIDETKLYYQLIPIYVAMFSERTR